MLEIWMCKREDGGFGKPIEEHHYECVECGFHAFFTRIIEGFKGYEAKRFEEHLRRLGYI